jgi:hypothetical protein
MPEVMTSLSHVSVCAVEVVQRIKFAAANRRPRDDHDLKYCLADVTARAEVTKHHRQSEEKIFIRGDFSSQQMKDHHPRLH